MKTARRINKAPAFTLLEIIVALSMLVLILGSVYGTYIATTNSLAHSKPKHALQQKARIFLQRISSEIRCSYAGNQNQLQEPLPRNMQKKKDISLFTGKEVSSGQSFLRFVTSAATSKRDNMLGGLAIIEYMLDESTKTLSKRKRRYVSGFDYDKNNYNWTIAMDNVQAIMVEYSDGKQWLKEWDSNDMKGILPKAVKILFILQTEDAGPLSFKYTVQTACEVIPSREGNI